MKPFEGLGNSSGSQPVSPDEALAKVQRRFKKVLLVDDSESLVETLVIFFELEGFSARGVHGGTRAMEAYDQDVPDIAFIDIAMPDVDGLAVARHFRSSEREKRTLLVALTGWGEDAVKQDAERAGFDFFMSKPLAPTSIRNFMARLVCDQLESGDQESTGCQPD